MHYLPCHVCSVATADSRHLLGGAVLNTPQQERARGGQPSGVDHQGVREAGILLLVRILISSVSSALNSVSSALNSVSSLIALVALLIALVALLIALVALLIALVA